MCCRALLNPYLARTSVTRNPDAEQMEITNERWRSETKVKAKVSKPKGRSLGVQGKPEESRDEH